MGSDSGWIRLPSLCYACKFESVHLVIAKRRLSLSLASLGLIPLLHRSKRPAIAGVQESRPDWRFIFVLFECQAAASATALLLEEAGTVRIMGGPVPLWRMPSFGKVRLVNFTTSSLPGPLRIEDAVAQLTAYALPRKA